MSCNSSRSNPSIIAFLASYIPDEKVSRGRREEFSALKYIIEMEEATTI